MSRPVFHYFNAPWTLRSDNQRLVGRSLSELLGSRASASQRGSDMRRVRLVLIAAAAVVALSAAPAQASQKTFVTACNQPVSGTVELANDIVCPDTDGLIVVSDNTVIDLKGHRILRWLGI